MKSNPLTLTGAIKGLTEKTAKIVAKQLAALRKQREKKFKDGNNKKKPPLP